MWVASATMPVAGHRLERPGARPRAEIRKLPPTTTRRTARAERSPGWTCGCGRSRRLELPALTVALRIELGECRHAAADGRQRQRLLAVRNRLGHQPITAVSE